MTQWKRTVATGVLSLVIAAGATAGDLSTTYIGEGSISPGVGVQSYYFWQTASITATPAPGWHFDHWEGDLSGTNPNASLGMGSDRRVTAVFMPDTPDSTNALQRYVGELDTAYGWYEHDVDNHFGWNKYTLRMTSQEWRDSSEVDRPLWEHDLGIVRPWFPDDDVALLVNGGSNDSDPPEEIDDEFALATIIYGFAYAQVDMVPNQPLYFTDETNVERKEDAILAYSLDKALVTSDLTWAVHCAMTKATVRAMDAIQEYLGDAEDFVVAGGSKRGWTTYLTAAVDPRVRAMAPLSIDIPNLDENVRNHLESFGFYTPSVSDYEEFDIFCRVDDPAGQELLDVVDPYSYFSKYTMPTLVGVSTGDQFFPPDSSRFYYNDLPGDKRLRYNPNTDHAQSEAAIFTALEWAKRVLNGSSIPNYTATFQQDGSIRVETQDNPNSVKLWQATNPNARDFRLEEIGAAYTSTTLTDQGGGVYIGSVSTPSQGWTAYLVELDFGDNLIFTSEVGITPDTLPYEGQTCQ